MKGFFRRRIKKGYAAGRESYERALDLLLRSDREAALDLLRLAVKQDPGNVHAYIRLGDLLRESGEIDRAVKIHADLRLRSDLDREFDTRILLSLARDYNAAGRWERTVACLKEIRGGIKDRPDALRLMVVALERQDLWKDALDRRMDLLKLEGGIPDKTVEALYHADVARRLIKRNSLEQAGARLKESLKLDGRNPAALYYLGRLKESLGDPEGAVEAWDRFAEHHPARACRAYERLEKALFELGRIDGLIERYRRVLRAVPGQPRTALALARFHLRMDNRSEGRQVLEQALVHAPADETLKRELAGILRADSECEKAADLLLESSTGGGANSPPSCSVCGHKPGDFLWYCPSCLAFDSFKE
jgi:lipopolysaccharide biosynthesis regulator YciM